MFTALIWLKGVVLFRLGTRAPMDKFGHVIDGMNSTEVIEEVENATILMTKFDSSPRQWVKIEVQFSGLLRSCTR